MSGPTAIGKTAMAIALAQHLNTEIISSDSRQFFKEMTIGTAVPDAEELQAAKHHFIQHISIHDPYTVGDFEKDALGCLEHLFKKHDYVIMAGGSGLYADALIKGIDAFPEVDASVREALNTQFREKGIQSLQQLLLEKDPVYYEKVDIHNPHRLIRALEICIASGKPYSSFLNQPKPDRPFTTLKIGLNASRELIYKRINDRVDKMMEAGLLEEAKQLYPYKDLNALQTVGYKEIFDHLDGHVSLDHAVEEIKKNTRRFAKRQLTWYRKDPEITWFDYDADPQDVFAFIKKEVGGGES